MQEVRSEIFPGSIEEFRAQMERLHGMCKPIGEWESSAGERLEFRESLDTKEIPTKTTWMINIYVPFVDGKRGASPGAASIDGYQNPGGKSARVQFRDGYSSSGKKDYNLIGQAFGEFTDWVIGEVWQPEQERATVDLGTRPPGRPRDPLYNEVFQLIEGGMAEKDAFEAFCKKANITRPDKSIRDAFKAAMKRRR